MRLSVFFFAATIAAAQPSGDILLRQDFEGHAVGWFVAPAGGGPGSEANAVRIDRAPGHAHSGSGALAFTYEARPRQMAAEVMPAPPQLARMTRLRFWLKTDRARPIAVLLSERKPGGGNYNAWIWSPAETWQQVDLTPADFSLAEGPNDPKDSDGKLDLDHLQAIGILDIGMRFPQMASGPSNSHTLWIDDFEAFAGDAAPVQDGMVVDDFRRGFVAWISPTGATLQLAQSANPLNEPSLQVSYEQADQPFPSIVRQLHSAGLARATRLEFDIASEKESTVNVSLEMSRPGAAQGPRFNLPIYPPGEREVFHVSIKLADFRPAGGPAVPEADVRVEPALLKTLALVDVSAATGDPGRNTLWIGNVHFQ